MGDASDIEALLKAHAIQQRERGGLHLESFTKRWGAIVGVVAGAMMLVDIGVRISARNDAYATEGELGKLNTHLDKIDERLGKIEKAADEVRISDLKPLATSANAQAVDAQTKVAAVDNRVRRIERSIEGFNKRASARGQITPLPLQDE